MPAVAEILEKVASRVRTKEADVEARYAAAIVSVADGEEPPKLEATIEGAEKTPAQFQADVEQLLHRRELRQQLAGADAAAAELSAIARERRNATEELGRAQQAFNETVAKLAVRENAAHQLARAAHEATNELRATAPQTLKQRLEAIGQERNDLDAKRQEHRQTLGRVRLNVPHFEALAERQPTNRKHYLAEKAKVEQRVAALESQQQEFDAALAALETKSASVLQQMLEP